MKKSWFYLLLLVFASFQLAGCAEEDDEDDIYTIGKEFDGAYLGTLTRVYPDAVQTVVPQKVIVSKSNRDEMVNLAIRYLIIDGSPNLNLRIEEVSAVTDKEGGILTLSTLQTVQDTGNGLVYDLTLDGTINGKVLDIKAKFDFKTPADWGVIESTFKGEIPNQVLGSEADIVGLGFTQSDNIINGDATRSINDPREIHIAINKEVTHDQLKALTPIYDLSEGATVRPEMGTTFDFTEPVELEVTSADGVLVRKYTLKVLDRPEKITFDTWQPANPSKPIENQYQLPFTNQPWLKWESSDIKYAVFMHNPVEPEAENEMKKPLAELSVQPTTDAKRGTAVKIITQRGVAQDVYGIPAIVSGMLYTGVSGYIGNSTVEQPLFGVPIHYKPISLKGFYKYTKGETYYEAIYPNAPYEVEEMRKDNRFLIRAVLYSVSNSFDDSSVLTYPELFGSDRIVAVAELMSSEPKGSYTEFDIPFTYTKEFNSKSDYRIALLFTSSAETENHSGAPGSILYVDEVEIVTE